MCDKDLTQIQEWIDFALKNYDLFNYIIEIEGQTNKGDGYSTDVNFVKVTGSAKDGTKQTLNLAIKSSKDSEAFREQTPTKEVFSKEIYIYNVVKTTFQNFLKEKGIDQIINVNPHCYGARMTEKSEFLIFENLKHQGFQLWNRALPVTLKHAQLVLEAYGRWHAFSVALKTQKPDVYEELIRNNVNMFSDVVIKMKFDTSMIQQFENAKRMAINDNEQEILKDLQYSDSDIKYALTDMFFEDPEDHVILHGDCWNSNFMFKSSDDKTNPSEVRLLDWQCSGLASPAFDLSHFIYCCVDTGEYENVKDLLEIYYDSFSRQLIQLNCDPEKAFPFEKLIKQWKKFSRFGLFLSFFVIRICLMNSTEIPDIAEQAERKQDIMDLFKFTNSDDTEFIKRARNNFLHYCKNLNS